MAHLRECVRKASMVDAHDIFRRLLELVHVGLVQISMENFIDMLSKIPELLRCVRKVESGVERILLDETICVQEARVLRKNLWAEKTEQPLLLICFGMWLY